MFYPHAHILTASDTRILEEYVEEGGTLVFGCWSGYRDKNHWCYDAEGRAFYEAFVGVRVADFTVVPPDEKSEISFTGSTGCVEAPIFNEVLEVHDGDVDVLASYAASYYAGTPAVTLLRKGKGSVIHFGSFFTRQNVSALLDALEIQDPIRIWADVPAAVEAISRSDGIEQFCFLLNFADQPQRLNFKQPALILSETAPFKVPNSFRHLAYFSSASDLQPMTMQASSLLAALLSAFAITRNNGRRKNGRPTLMRCATWAFALFASASSPGAESSQIQENIISSGCRRFWIMRLSDNSRSSSAHRHQLLRNGS